MGDIWGTSDIMYFAQSLATATQIFGWLFGPLATQVDICKHNCTCEIICIHICANARELNSIHIGVYVCVCVRATFGGIGGANPFTVLTQTNCKLPNWIVQRKQELAFDLRRHMGMPTQNILKLCNLRQCQCVAPVSTMATLPIHH